MASVEDLTRLLDEDKPHESASTGKFIGSTWLAAIFNCLISLIASKMWKYLDTCVNHDDLYCVFDQSTGR